MKYEMNSTIVNSAHLIDQFTSLATIDGVSLDERRIADHVKTELKKINVRVVEDNTAALINGNTGNLICLPPTYDATKPAIALCAHLDTVQSTKNLKPIVTETKITSDGTTILGADNREGLSILLYLLKNLKNAPRPTKNFIVVLTVGEELGMFGANHVDLSPYHVSAAFIFDCSKRPGIYIKDSPGCLLFTATFHGKSAHAGVAPEEGISAISLAGNAIAKIHFGRIDPETTSNIGKISGGSATNVVADEVILEGEIRSFTRERIEQEYAAIQKAFTSSINGKGSCSFHSQMDFHPYILSSASPIVKTIESAIAAVGLTPEGIRYTGGSDANSYNAKGIPAVNIGTGAQKPHSFEEFILIEDLITSTEIAFELIQN